MPLRFDQPSLLGEWKGDPAIIHQALSQMHSASEGEKNRANERAIAQAKAPKKPSFKISSAEAPFSKDVDHISGRVEQMLDSSFDDNTKARLDQENLAHSAKAKAQEKQLNALEQNSNILAQKYGENYVPTKLNALSSRAINDDDIYTRPQTLADYAKAQQSPEDYINSDGVLTKHINNAKEISIKDESLRESGSRTDINNFEIHTKFPVKGDPLLMADGTQKVENGVPQFKSTRAKSPSELLEYANSYLESDQNVRRATYRHTYDKNKKTIDDNTESWVKSMENAGQKPSESEIKSYMDGQTEKLAQEYVATKMFKDDKARIDGGIKVSFEKPTEADKDKSFAKSWGTNGSYSTTFTSAENSGKRNTVFLVNGKATEGSVKTYGELGVARKDKNGEPKPVIIRSDKGAWNASRGEYIPQGLEMNVGGVVIMAIDKKTGLPKPTNKTPEQLQKEGTKFDLFVEGKMLLAKENKAIKKEDVSDYENYVALNNKPYLSTDNNGVNEQEEFNKLEAKFAKQGQSSYVMKKLDNNISNQLSGNDVNGFLDKNSENKKIKLELDRLNKGVVAKPTTTKPKTEAAQPKTTTTKVKGAAVPTNPNIKLSLIDQIKKEMPNATSEQWVSEYKKRSK